MDVSDFVIRDLSGPPSAVAVEMVLTGRGLPLGDFSLVTSQRLNVTWLPGYAQGIGQPLGPQENTTTLRGKWSDKYLAESAEQATNLGPLGNAFSGIDNDISAAAGTVGLGSGALSQASNITIPVMYRNQRVPSAYEAAEIVDEMVRGGVYIEVRWDRHARRGYLTKFTKDWRTSRDLSWELECTWTSRAEANPPAVTPEFGMSDTVSLFQQLADTLNTEALPPTFPMAMDVVADLEAGIKRIVATTKAMFDTIANIEALLVAPFGVARMFIAQLKTLRGQADALRNRLEASPAAGLRTNKAEASPAILAQGSTTPALLRAESTTSFAESVAAVEYVTRVGSILKSISRNATIQESDYLKKVEQQSEAVVMTREGDNLRDLSTRYYGVPDQWRRIAMVNGLSAGALGAGTMLVIPRLDDGDRC